MKEVNRNVKYLPRRQYPVYVLVCLVFFTLIYLYYNIFNGLASLILLFLSIVVCLSLAIIGIVRLYKSKSLFFLIISGVLLLTSFFALFISNKIDDHDFSETKVKAESIIKAIESYYKDNDKFPMNLDELVPHYITNIPEANTYNPNDREFYYSIDNETYQLIFYMNSGCPYFYDTKDKKWYPQPKG